MRNQPRKTESRLFNACFRIQLEACEASGRRIPMVVENVKGAQPWVGRARWNFGSFYLWGDLPALMPHGRNNGAIKVASLDGGCRTDVGKGARFTSRDCGVEGRKCGGDWFSDNNPSAMCRYSSKSPKRKMASAMIAKIPFDLSRHVAAAWYPSKQQVSA